MFGCLWIYAERTVWACFVSSIGVADAGNVYGVVPVNAARDVSIILMVIHQFVAYALYVTPVMWEKLVGTHTKSYWIRLPSRIPVCKPLGLRSQC